MSYHDQSDPPLIAQGAPSKLTMPWYLVLQAWYLIKTNLQVLISTVFVWGGSTFIPFLCLNQSTACWTGFVVLEAKKGLQPRSNSWREKKHGNMLTNRKKYICKRNV